MLDAVDDRTGYPIQGTDYAYFSILSKAMGTETAAEVDPEKAAAGWDMVSNLAEKDPATGAAVAALIGLAIGDAVGHPFEFIAVDATLPKPDANGVLSYPAHRPHLRSELAENELGEKFLDMVASENKFELKRGQWTDDCSMALCLADTLLAHKGYHGGDARLRWHKWWNYGYCNTFRHEPPLAIEDPSNPGQISYCCPRPSIGLGGNIAMSIMEINDLPEQQWEADDVPPIYGSKNEDAGNGSIMRLAPVPIAFHKDLDAALKVAECQSRATHPGPDAVACCKFMTYLIIKALKAHENGEKIGASGETMRRFVDSTIANFVAEYKAKDTGMSKLHSILASEPPSARECNWDWRAPEMRIREAIRERRSSEDGRYNGYPVIPTYWGAYCMDGLAMALWALYHSTSFSECIVKTVNLLGDADTTGAIAAQMAGAIYGWEGIVGSEMGQVFLKDLKQWDPYCEVCCFFDDFFNFIGNSGMLHDRPLPHCKAEGPYITQI